MITALMTWIADSCPNWIKPLPGLILLGISGLALLGGAIWPFGFIVGGLALVIGVFTIKTGKDSGYNF